MFIAELVATAKIWKQPKCSHTDEWIKNMQYINIYVYILECYSAIKKNEIMPFAATWEQLEVIVLSEAGQTEKTTYHYDITYMWYLKKR